LVNGRISDAVIRPGAVPSAEHDPAIIENGGVQVVALIEGDLLQARPVGADDVQVECKFIAILVHVRECAFAFVQ
jgi:hypothetical protein